MYDEVNRRMGIDAGNLPEGLISHQAGSTDGGMLIVDVWESAEAFQRFADENAGPALQ